MFYRVSNHVLSNFLYMSFQKGEERFCALMRRRNRDGEKEMRNMTLMS